MPGVDQRDLCLFPLFQFQIPEDRGPEAQADDGRLRAALEGLRYGRVLQAACRKGVAEHGQGVGPAAGKPGAVGPQASTGRDHCHAGLVRGVLGQFAVEGDAGYPRCLAKLHPVPAQVRGLAGDWTLKKYWIFTARGERLRST